VKERVLRFHASLAELPPEQLPLLLSVGLVLGVFPIVGFPTVFCLLAAICLRVNPAALQVVNTISSPLQLALLLPLARAGQKLCGTTALPGRSWIGQAGIAVLHAIAGWACICVPLGALLYVSLLWIARKGRPACA
jgi:hypothetical protein